MALCPLIFLCRIRGNFDWNIYHTSWCMRCFIEGTIMVSFLGAWRHKTEKRFYLISMMNQPGDSSRVTPQHTSLCGPIFSSLHYSRMHMLMLQVFGLSKVRWQKPKVSNPVVACCSGKTIPTVGLGYHWGPTFIEAKPLYSNCYRLFHVVDKGSSAEISEQSGSHQLPIVENHL